MQGHQITPFTIDNILNGSLFSTRCDKETRSEADSPARIAHPSVTSVNPEEEDSVDVEGSDWEASSASHGEVSSASHGASLWSSDVESSLSNHAYHSTQSDSKLLQNRKYKYGDY
jgi:hypothetical protein